MKTKQKKSNKRKKIEQSLQDSQEKYRLLIQGSSAAITFFDKKGAYLLLNSVAAKLLNGKPEDYIGKTVYDTFPKSKADMLTKKFRRIIKSGNGETIEEKIETLNRWVSSNLQPVKDQNQKIIGVSVITNDITRRKKVEEEIRYKSFRDTLTGLYNRSFFEEEMKRLDTKRQLPLSIIIGDLNSLKLTNDAFGHIEGDKLLRKMAGVFKDVCREEDVIARWGGDEFAVLLPRTDNKTAIAICVRIREACREINYIIVPLSIALGVGTKTKIDTDIKKVIREAEDKMYTNKLLNEKGVRGSIIVSLQRELNKKSHETAEHSERLKKLALQTGQYLKLSDNELDLLELSATLHDIGKIAVPEQILKKSGGLSIREWDKIKKHPQIGYGIAKLSPESASIAEIIWSHHEWWDGKGYPRGLKKNEIPLISRIISIIDAYDVMTAGERPYREKLSHKEALAELKEKAGIAFDPDLVKSFINMMSGLKNN